MQGGLRKREGPIFRVNKGKQIASFHLSFDTSQAPRLPDSRIQYTSPEEGMLWVDLFQVDRKPAQQAYIAPPTTRFPSTRTFSAHV